MQSLQERIEREHSSIVLQNGRRHPELLACFDLCMRVFEQCRSLLRPLSLADIRDCRDDEVAHSGDDRIEADLDGELASVLSHSEEVAARSHLTHLRGGRKRYPPTDMSSAQTVRDQHFDSLANEVLAAITERLLHPRIQQNDAASRIHGQKAGRRRLEQKTKSLVRAFPLDHGLSLELGSRPGLRSRNMRY